jgi:hypothetical protein
VPCWAQARPDGAGGGACCSVVSRASGLAGPLHAQLFIFQDWSRQHADNDRATTAGRRCVAVGPGPQVRDRWACPHAARGWCHARGHARRHGLNHAGCSSAVSAQEELEAMICLPL